MKKGKTWRLLLVLLAILMVAAAASCATKEPEVVDIPADEIRGTFGLIEAGFPHSGTNGIHVEILDPAWDGIIHDVRVYFMGIEYHMQFFFEGYLLQSDEVFTLCELSPTDHRRLPHPLHAWSEEGEPVEIVPLRVGDYIYLIQEEDHKFIRGRSPERCFIHIIGEDGEILGKVECEKIRAGVTPPAWLSD